MADELIDIYDSEMNLLGTAMKSQAHDEGLWHKTFHCWIVDGDKVWLQLRGKGKKLYPGLLDISVAGHLGTGETAKGAGVREIEEELGLAVCEDDFCKLFTCRLAEDTADMRIREFCPTYVLKSRWKLSDVIMQPEEVDGIFAAKISEMTELFGGDIKDVKIKGFLRDSSRPAERTVAAADFAPHGENYYLKIFSTLERYTEK
ncbi:MAG: NUDIX domain-containing protein [Alphaproteobacteria bacterium]|nr:NUDIX domain-containing protein [Alphaproteobacteria bacterium]